MAVPVERLVVMVSEYDYLYDMTKKLYHNPQLKEATWAQIGRCLGVSGKCLTVYVSTAIMISR